MRVARTPLAERAAEGRDRLSAMGAVASRFEGWRPAGEVLLKARGVPTIFPWVDRVTRVLGWPTDRPGLIHGPSNHGKTEFVLGLGASFLARDHFFALVDAEYTTPIDWVEELVGPELVRHPGFCALRPRTYEQTVDAVRRWAETIGEAKARGEVPPDTTGLVAVDSIRKLVPKRLMQTLLKEGADGEEKSGARKKPGGIDGMGGRAAMYKAALNSQWMDELVPLMAHTGTAIAIITREYENDESDFFSEDFKLAGGKSLFFDSSIVSRVLLEGQVWEGEGKDRRTLGERHRVEIRKTKVGGKEEKVPKAWFHTSNGADSPAGFDRARDLLDVALDLGVVELRGSYYSLAGERVGQGAGAVLKNLRTARLASSLRGAVDDAIRSETAAYRAPKDPNGV
jgi:RecA/RadA recombinase